MIIINFDELLKLPDYAKTLAFLQKHPGLTEEQMEEKFEALRAKGISVPPHNYTYLIVSFHPNCLPDDCPQYYMGSRGSTIERRPPWNDGYWGSSYDYLDPARRELGPEFFVKYILEIFETRQQAFDAEAEFHEEYQVEKNPKFFNMVRQTANGFIPAVIPLTPEQLAERGEILRRVLAPGTPAHQNLLKAVRTEANRFRAANHARDQRDSLTPEEREQIDQKRSESQNARLARLAEEGRLDAEREAAAERSRQFRASRTPEQNARTNELLSQARARPLAERIEIERATMTPQEFESRQKERAARKRYREGRRLRDAEKLAAEKLAESSENSTESSENESS